MDTSKTPTSSKEIKRRAKKGIFQLGATKSTAKIINALGFIVVARFLEPGEIGIASIVSALILVSRALVRMGLPTAIVQSDTFSKDQASSLFWLNVVWGSVYVSVLGLLSPAIEHYYQMEELGILILCGAPQLLLISLRMVPEKTLERNLRFGYIAVFDAIGIFGSTITKVVLAILGAGAFALVLGSLAQQLVTTILIFAYSRYGPGLCFKWNSISPMIKFGAQISVTGFMHMLQRRVDYFIIGKVLGEEILGLYRVGFEIVLSPLTTITQLFNRVLFSAYARFQMNHAKLLKYFYQTSRTLLLVIGPICAFMFVNALEVLDLLYGSKYLSSAMIVQFFAVVGIQRYLSRLLPRLINAVGRADLTIWYSLFSIAVLTSGFILALHFWGDSHAILAICLTWLLSYPLIWGLLLGFAKTTVDLSFAVYFKSLLPALLGIVVMGGGMYGVKTLHITGEAVVNLFLIGLTGCIVYYGYMKLFLKIEFKKVFK